MGDYLFVKAQLDSKPLQVCQGDVKLFAAIPFVAVLTELSDKVRKCTNNSSEVANDKGVYNDIFSELANDKGVCNDIFSELANDKGVCNDIFSELANDKGVYNDISSELANDKGVYNDISSELVNDKGVYNDISSELANDKGVYNDISSELVNDKGVYNDIYSELANDKGVYNDISSELANDKGVYNNISLEVTHLQTFKNVDDVVDPSPLGAEKVSQPINGDDDSSTWIHIQRTIRLFAGSHERHGTVHTKECAIEQTARSYSHLDKKWSLLDELSSCFLC
uniref:Uncharacterized protein n=1 Tax=Timema monikensis TaxID=170555 RepID=A0A7R9E417_9NEOP|nr:unnamed protein product [Timema monikensis]